MKKSFMVETQRPFQSNPLRREFDTRAEMHEYILSLKNSHFVGALEPMVRIDGMWEVDEEGMKLLDLATLPEQQMILSGASKLLATLSKIKRELTPEEKENLDSELRLIYQVCALDVEPAIDMEAYEKTSRALIAFGPSEGGENDERDQWTAC